MITDDIDVDQVSYIESVPDPQSVGNLGITLRGSRYWTPVVPDNEKPVENMLFVSLDEAFEFYSNYAKKVDLNLVDVGNLNMGPRKGFKVLKQARGRFDKVGATKTDSENYKGDIDLFIGEGDAHMTIEKLEKKRVVARLFI
nr:protein FAR1-related sequence 5-like isoform X1 [Tanacetum cinerariifolium]